MSDLDGLEPSPAVTGQIYPTGGMTRADIIEAGARAAWHANRAGIPDSDLIAWERMHEGQRDMWRRLAAGALDAMEPWITLAATQANNREWCANMDSAGVRPDGQPFDEAVLDAIRATERAKVAEEIAAVIHDRFEHMTGVEHWASMKTVADWCEREAREAGKR